MSEQRKAPQHMPLETILVTAIFTIETPGGYDQSKEAIEGALNTACTFLETEGLSVTYRIKQVENL